MRFSPFRIRRIYEVYGSLGGGNFGSVFSAFNVLTGEKIAVKVEMPSGKDDSIPVLPYEAAVYRQLAGLPGIPCIHWHGMDGGAHVMALDLLGPNLQELRRACRGQLSYKTVLMLADQMIDRVESVHSRGIILRDLKPENFAVGNRVHSNMVYMFDFGLAKLYLNWSTKEHIPYREGRDGLGTPRYASANVHFGLEQSRRDDMIALGHVLLYLLHGKLPWQGVFAPDIKDKLLRIGEMKVGKAFRELLHCSPLEFTTYFDHCHALAFQDRPDYAMLKTTFRNRMLKEGWSYDGKYDWIDPASLEKGTLADGEYKFDARFVDKQVWQKWH